MVACFWRTGHPLADGLEDVGTPQIWNQQTENGATFVLPGTHHVTAFPPDRFVQKFETQIEAPSGSYIVLDAMLFQPVADCLLAIATLEGIERHRRVILRPVALNPRQNHAVFRGKRAIVEM